MDATYLQEFLSASARGAKRNEIRELLKLTAQPDVISLAGGMPSAQTFPVDELVELIPEALRRFGSAALQYGPTEGDVGLRGELASLMCEAEGPAFTGLKPDQILVTSASQQALDLCSRVFITPGDAALCGLPSYLGALGAFTACGARLGGVPLDEHGMRMDLLEQRLVQLRGQGVRPKFVYVVPDFQNPCGVTLSLERRHELLAIAREFDLLVIEDSPYRDLRYVGTAQPTLCALDTDGRVISLFTVSKILSPGLRLGWVIASEEVIFRLTVAKQPVDLCTSGLTQVIVREYLRAGLLWAQIQSIRTLYAGKRNAMLEALDRHFDPAWGVRWTRPEGGLFLWVSLPASMSARKLLERALHRKVAFVVGEAFHCDGSGANTLRLNFSYPNTEQIDHAIAILASCVEQMLGEQQGSAGGEPSIAPAPVLVAGDHALDHLALSLGFQELVE